jgi:hypothetical protein
MRGKGVQEKWCKILAAHAAVAGKIGPENQFLCEIGPIAYSVKMFCGVFLFGKLFY